MGTWGDDDEAERVTLRLLDEHADQVGIYVAGGGIVGVLNALEASKKPYNLVVVGYQNSEQTRRALEEGILNLAISYPLAVLARETLRTAVDAVGRSPEFTPPSVELPISVFTPENI